jgi:hypothetical protein
MERATMEADSALSEERVHLVEQASRALQEAVELDAVLRVALESVVPALADLAVLVLDETPGGPRLDVAHLRRELEPRLRREVTPWTASAAPRTPTHAKAATPVGSPPSPAALPSSARTTTIDSGACSVPSTSGR